MKSRLHIALLAVALCMTTVINAIPSRPSPPRLVNDLAGIFSAQQRSALENALVEFDDSTSNQIAIVTVPDLEGYTAMEYATRIGLDWQVGSEKFDNGIVMLIKPKTPSSNGEAAISVGYGLEGAIPDVYAKRIIENELIPHFRNNDYYGGVAAACTVLMQLASGEISEPGEKQGGAGLGTIVISFLFLMILIVIFSGNRNGGNGGGRRNYHSSGPDLADAIIIGSILGGSRGGSSSWGGSSGGFGGFGGFGGGSFGGGGASGSW